MKNFKFYAVKVLIILICLGFALTGFEISAFQMTAGTIDAFFVFGFAICVISGTAAAIVADRWTPDYE